MGSGQVLAAWFPRAAGRPLSLTLRCGTDLSGMPPAIFPAISTFQAQLVRLELCLPLQDFQMLNAIGGSFRSVRRISDSLSDSLTEIGIFAAFREIPNFFQRTPGLRELCLGTGFSISTVDAGAGIPPLLTALDLSEPISFEAMLVLVQRFPHLKHLDVYPKNGDPTGSAELLTLSQLHSLNIGFRWIVRPLEAPQSPESQFPLRGFERTLLPLPHFAFGLCAATFALRMLDHGDVEQLQGYLSAFPSLTLQVDNISQGSANFIFECLIDVVFTVPHLRALMISTTGPLDYGPVMLMSLAARYCSAHNPPQD
ncbi:hypothetical protein B0H17DRAFT_1147688 [Mycena rosella]|uniref:Uncharacterized protein n=1 Tax=Mycena rosella TaxID=1033263 RepID=A0AAD7FY15_MYCRO|nr:hypothetical protein B0H17DRAFT_1147688 [Mycena rosella]